MSTRNEALKLSKQVKYYRLSIWAFPAVAVIFFMLATLGHISIITHIAIGCGLLLGIYVHYKYVLKLMKKRLALTYKLIEEGDNETFIEIMKKYW